ncbi:MAG: hypothetical protein JRG97_01435 [Deltaproteobacteria bacterium]|nr:hypothetical protein [Deltaproteobacteria bacterium]MBW2053738.1 hypothetical protein [Deltaproteobacteria bacterium]MBW2139718.1 hypothetical protein [Deltaproteobacteria bacterium]
MAEVIDIKGRVKQKKDLSNLEKLEGLWNIIQCAKCAMRCAKCGTHGEPTSQVGRSGTSFKLCSSCMEEYQQVITELGGNPSRPKPFWYNREWLRHWVIWLEYQQVLNDYIDSPEVYFALKSLAEE